MSDIQTMLSGSEAAGSRDKWEQDHTTGKVLADYLDENDKPDAPFFRNLAHRQNPPSRAASAPGGWIRTTWEGDGGLYEPRNPNHWDTFVPDGGRYRLRYVFNVDNKRPALLVSHYRWDTHNTQEPVIQPNHTAILHADDLERWLSHPDVARRFQGLDDLRFAVENLRYWEEPTKLSADDTAKTRVSNVPRIVEDLRQYRQQVRPGLAALHARGDRRITFNSDAEHELIHKFVTNRGLKVAKSDYTYYDDATHTLYHPNPEDRVAVARGYVRMVAGAVKLSRLPEDHHPFHDKIAENTREDTPILVYADWLEEQGHPVLASFLREVVDSRMGKPKHKHEVTGMHSGHVIHYPFKPESPGYKSNAVNSVFNYRGLGDYVRAGRRRGKPSVRVAVKNPHRSTVDGKKGYLVFHLDTSPALAADWTRRLLEEGHPAGNVPPVKLARIKARKLARGDNQEQAFHEALAADPNDHTSRLVYADWLDEHGAGDVAALIRWWVGAREYLNEHGRTGGPSFPLSSSQTLPQRVRHLLEIHSRVNNPFGSHALVPGHATAELNAYGALSPKESRGARRRANEHHNAAGHTLGTYLAQQRPPAWWDEYNRQLNGHSPAGAHGPAVAQYITDYNTAIAAQHAAWMHNNPEAIHGGNWGWSERLHEYARDNPPPLPPVHLARITGHGSAVRQTGSDNHAKRIALAKHILSEAGLTPATARQVLSHTDERGVRPAVAAMIARDVDPKLARFAAAWMGLLLQEKAVTVFHPGDGEDTLHVIDSPHPAAHVGEYLKRAGVPSFTLENQGKGTRVYVVAPMDLTDVKTAAGGIQGTHSAVRGTAARLGSATSDADARAAFRQVIDDAEREAGMQ